MIRPLADPDCKPARLLSSAGILKIHQNWKSRHLHARKSKVDPIFILDRRRTFLARFWTPQARLRPPNTTSESKMYIFKFHNFRSWYQEFKMIAEFSLEKNQWIQLNFVFLCYVGYVSYSCGGSSLCEKCLRYSKCFVKVLGDMCEARVLSNGNLWFR